MVWRNLPKRGAVKPARFGEAGRHVEKDHPKYLLIAAALVIVVPYLPFGNFVFYPFMILTTWFHEMGHGLTAMLFGMEFDRLVLLPSGSGYAEIRAPIDSSALAGALVSAGGPLGPAVAGALLILASQTARTRQIALGILAAVILLSTLIWVRSPLGWIVLPAIGGLILWVMLRGSQDVQRFAVQFFGVHAAISMFGQWRYLFSTGGSLGGSHQVSDTGAIAQQLFLPHWFWAGAIIMAGAAMIAASLYRVIGQYRRR